MIDKEGEKGILSMQLAADAIHFRYFTRNQDYGTFE